MSLTYTIYIDHDQTNNFPEKKIAYIFLLHISSITLIILLLVSVSRCDDANYIACSIPYTCGGISVGYPFWGDNRPKLCGIPDLKLKCNEADKNSTSIDVTHRGYTSLSVVGIDNSSHTMNLSLDNLFKCYIINKRDGNNNNSIAFFSSLKLSPGYSNITLYHDCSSKCQSKYNMSLDCSNNEGPNTVTAYYFDKPSKFNSTSCSCKRRFTFPVDKRVFDELKGTSKNALQLRPILRKWSVQMNYAANFSACSKCSQSGGRCGSPDNSSSDRFTCYCRNGAQELVCPRESDQLVIILGLVVGGGAAFVLVVITTIWCCMKKSRSKFLDRGASFDCSASELEKGSKYYSVPLFSYRELVEATNNFDKELGNGGFGTVYHGKLNDGRELAVKRLYEKNYKRLEQFMNEVRILTHLRHHNLVSLYGCTSQHCKELLLVYEYVQNGTVADHLFGKDRNSQPSPLPWPIRLRIAIETATALSYLHKSDIIHRDVKTNNILLDSNFSVKVADFGLSRLFPTDVTHVSTAPQGTPGYLDPEYHQCYQLTVKSDVYSFGVVLVELISSLPAIDMNRHRHEINLSNYAINRIKQSAFDELVDPQLGFASDFKVRRMTISVAEVAFLCLQHDKGFRPSMDEVLEALKRIESADYDALLQAENMNDKEVQEVVKLHSSNLLLPPPPSPTEDDHIQLLQNHQLQPPSPISVIEKWVSTSTTPNTSK